MLEGKKIVVVMPAYNAEKTLRKTVEELPGIVDHIIVVDDFSRDNTKEVAKSMGLHYICHDKNKGYGGNQKTCYAAALKEGADIVIMVHPDYQYSPKLATAMAGMLVSGHYDIILASRILGSGARNGGMPWWRYLSNRILTLAENILLRQKISEYHTGYRAFTKEVLEKLPLLEGSDDFVFDNEILVQAIFFKFRIGEISCPTRYFTDASSINFKRCVKYGVGVLKTALFYRLQKWRMLKLRLFDKNGKRLS